MKQTVLALALIVPVASVAAAKHAPLPAGVLQAKTAYIDNRSADAKLADHAYDELTKWGRFQIVDDPAKADLILRFSAKRRTSGHTTTADARTRAARSGSETTKVTTIDSVRTTSLSVLDGRTRHTLWSDSKENQLAPIVRDNAKSLIDELRKRIAEQETQEKQAPER